MAQIVLIHGAWFGGWCWSYLTPQLEIAGHTPTVTDLPGRGASRTRPELPTIQTFIDHVSDLLDTIDGKVHLVAHCIGGITATEVAERRPEKVASVIYVSALFNSPGQQHPPLYNDSLARVARRITNMGQYQVIRPDMEVQLLYHDCPPDRLEEVQGRLCREISDISPPPLGTAQHWPKLQRAYIMTTRNRGLSAAQQAEIVQQHGLAPVVEMETGHCPFFADPVRLASHIGSLVNAAERPAPRSTVRNQLTDVAMQPFAGA